MFVRYPNKIYIISFWTNTEQLKKIYHAAQHMLLNDHDPCSKDIPFFQLLRVTNTIAIHVFKEQIDEQI